MKTRNILLTVIAFLIAMMPVIAQVDFISAKDFKTAIKERKDIIVVDCSKTKKFKKSHLKGAIHINYKDLNKKGEIKGLLMAPEDLAKYFGDKGISETSEIVLYDGGKQKYSSRVYWILKYLGAENVKLLHKDMKEWGKVRLPLSSSATAPLPAVTFTPAINSEILVDMAFVREHLEDSSIVLVDLRGEDQYKGIDEKKKSDGHIHGAVHCSYKELENENGAFKSKEELESIFAAKGITPDKTVVMYCNTGVLGAVGFVVAMHLGYENVKLYDGSYKEWIVSNPVEK